jgi:hypothetical protein
VLVQGQVGKHSRTRSASACILAKSCIVMYFLLISADSNSRLGSADPQQNEPILLGLRRKSETFQAVRIQWGQLVLSEATTNSSLLHGCLTCDDEHQQKKPHNIPGMHGD